MTKILTILMVFLLTSSCNLPDGGKDSKSASNQGSTKTGNTENTKKTGKTEKTEASNPPLTEAQVKDKNPPQPLRSAVPKDFADEGWKKTFALVKDPAAIPATMPANNTVYYSAEKIIGGKARVIAVVYGDIVKEKDTIVNAANESLAGGGGVDGAIHDAAQIDGKAPMIDETELYKKQQNITSFPTGSAMATNPYGLVPHIKLVIHTVGPHGPSSEAKNLELYSAVYNSLLKANEFGAKSISIPPISMGIFNYPTDIGCELLFKAALQFFADHQDTTIARVNFISIKQSEVKALADRFIALFKK